MNIYNNLYNRFFGFLNIGIVYKNKNISNLEKFGINPYKTQLDHPNSIVTNLPEETKPLSKRSLSIETGNAKKKKKTKSVAEDPQEKAIEKLGQNCFALSTLPPPAKIQTSPVPIAPLLLQLIEGEKNFLTEEEKILFKEIVEQNTISANSNLYQAIMVDLHAQWKMIIASTEMYDLETKECIASAHKNFNIKEIFAFQLNLMLVEENSESDQFYNSQYFKKKSSMNEWLDNFIKQLTELNTLMSNCFSSRKTKLKRIPEKWVNKHKQATHNITQLQKRIIILQKCLNNKLSYPFYDCKITDWPEFSCLSFQDKISHVPKLTDFFKFFIASYRNVFNENISLTLNNYLDIVDKILTSKLNKQLITEYLLTYKNFVMNVANELDGFLTTKTNLKKIKNNSSNSNQEKFDHSLFKCKYFSLEVLDYWVSDLHQTLKSHHSSEFSQSFNMDPLAYVYRLERMATLKINMQKKNDVFDFNKRSAHPFLRSIQEQVENYHILKAFDQLPYEKYQAHLSRFLLKDPLSLSHCLFIFAGNFKIISSYKLSYFQLDEMRQKILDSVRAAKNEHLLDNCEPSALKKEIQALLFEASFQLCVNAMFIADIHALFSESPSNDILHLLPDDVVRWLDLTGFDEIFTEASTPAIVETAVDENSTLSTESEQLEEEDLPHNFILQSQRETSSPDTTNGSIIDSPVEETSTCSEEMQQGQVVQSQSQSQPQAKIPKIQKKLSNPQTGTDKSKKCLPSKDVPHLAKSSSLPKKQDFIEAVKRPLIVKMLEHMGFKFIRTGRHPIFHHPNFSGQVVVPLHIHAAGTRGSIYNQAMDVLERLRDDEDKK